MKKIVRNITGFPKNDKGFETVLRRTEMNFNYIGAGKFIHWQKPHRSVLLNRQLSSGTLTQQSGLMNTSITPEKRTQLLRQIMWDYSITPEEADAVLKNEAPYAGHYTKEMIFIKLLESYNWYTILQLIPVEEVKSLLSEPVINKLRSPALRKQYTYVRKRLQEVIPTAG